MESPPPQPHILIVRGGAIGDFILTLPAIQLLRNGLANPVIEILGYPAVTSLARDSGIADSVRSIEYAGLADFFNPSSILEPDLMDYFAGFDLVVSYLFDPDGFFQANLEKCGVKNYLACSHRIAEEQDHAAAQLARPLEQIALFLEEPAPRLSFPHPIQAEASRFIGLSPADDSPVALHPGSGSPSKNWPAKCWIDLISRLHEKFPRRPFVIATGEADSENAALLLHALREKSIPHTNAHALDLSTLGAILSHCALFIGHDSGISHLAAAAGSPCLLLFGPTNPDIWAPKNKPVTILRPSSQDLSDLSVDDVENQVETILP